MWSYEKEVERLTRLYEEVPTDNECYSDSDDSVADDEFEEMSQHDSESELEPENDEKLLPPPTNTAMQDSLYYQAKDGTKWKKNCTSKNVRTRQDNIIVRLPGVKGAAKNALSPRECWELFLDNAILEDIVDNTNIYIESISDRYTNKSDARPTDKQELTALLGLLYLAGVYHGGRTSIFEFWSTDGTGLDIFPATMALRRFRFLMRCLRMDNVRTREERKSQDNLAAVRNVLEKVVGNCQKYYTVGKYTTIDEMLWSFRGRCRFRMYIPNKPARYGIKVFSLVDSRSFYTYNMEVYCGKQQPGPFFVSNTSSDVVNRLCLPLSQSRRNVTMDNWFTSVEVANNLLKNHQLTVVGTLRKNKRQIPTEFFLKRPEKSSMFAFTEDMTMVSYIPKLNRQVILLSTLHHDDSIDIESGEDTKPEIITFYNSTKGGVDMVDQLCAKYNVARNTRRWPMVILYGLLNIIGINAFVIYKTNVNTDIQRRVFLKQLGKELVMDYMKTRACSRYLPREIRQLAAKISGTELPERVEVLENKRGRCGFCKDRKTRFTCRFCKIFICLEHTVHVCQVCTENFVK